MAHSFIYAVKFNEGLKFFWESGAPIVSAIKSVKIGSQNHVVTDEFLVGTAFKATVDGQQYDGKLINSFKAIQVESENEDDVKAVKEQGKLKFYYADGSQILESIKYLTVDGQDYSVENEFLVGTKFSILLNGSSKNGTLVSMFKDINGSDYATKEDVDEAEEAAKDYADSLVGIPEIVLDPQQIVSQSPFFLQLTPEQQAILEDLDNDVIKVDLSNLYQLIGLDSPYAWINRNATKMLGDQSNGAVTYEFVCDTNDIDATANMNKLGTIGIYYFYQATGAYITYSKGIIITYGKLTLANLSHATNIDNDSGSGSLLQVKIANSFTSECVEESGDYSTGATGVHSSVFGGISRAEGDSSLAQGKNTVAKGYGAHAEGSNTIAKGAQSHAEGYKSIAKGDNSHAEGTSTIAEGVASHTTGEHTIAKGKNQTVIGKFNVVDNDNEYAFIIGNGTSENARNNAFGVKWDGTVVGGGTQLYRHTLTNSTKTLYIISTSNTPIQYDDNVLAYSLPRGSIISSSMVCALDASGDAYEYMCTIDSYTSHSPTDPDFYFLSVYIRTSASNVVEINLGNDLVDTVTPL